VIERFGKGGKAMPEGMSEHQERFFLMFKSAIDSERKAQDIYQKSMELTDDEEFREVLDGFYQDEEPHEWKLMDQYNKINREFSITDE
jgi:rubrerythrin